MSMKKKEKVSPEDERLDRVLRKLVKLLLRMKGTDDWEMCDNGKCWAERRNYECVWLKSSELSNFF